MTGELTAQGLIDYRKSVVKVIPTATISFPGGNTRRYSIEGSPLQGSMGIYRDRLRDIGDIDYRLSDPRGGLQSVTTTLRLADMDGDIRSIVKRYGVSGLRGSAIVIEAATDSAPSDWRRDMTGILDGIEPTAAMEWSVVVRVDDRALVDGTFRIPRISSIDYRKALAPNLEKLIPVALGQFDSRDGTVAGSVGSVELIRTEETAGGGFPYRYLAGAPYFSHVQRVAVAGASLSSTQWVRTYTLRNSIATTEVWLTSDPGASKVTAELMGVGEDVSGSPAYLGANGTGSPIVNIVKQMRWLLRNYVWSAYLSGSFASDPAALHSATWDAAETWAEQRRYRGSFLINQSEQRPIDTFNAFCQWLWVRAGWTRLGKLALYPFTDEDAPYFSDTRWIRYAIKGSESAFLPSFPRDRSTNSIRSSSWVVPSTGSNRSIVSVRDSRLVGNVVTEINSGLGVARQKFQDAYPGGNPIVFALNAGHPGSQGNAVYLTSGSALTKWQDMNWSPADPSYDFPNSFRTDCTFLSTVGQEPKWYAGGLNGHPYIRFDGANDYMGSSSGGTIPVGEFTVWMVLRLNAAPAARAGSPELDAGIIADTTGNWGLYTHTDAGNYYIAGDNYDGGHVTLRKQVNLNTWYLVRLRHYSSVLYLSINNWDEVSTGSNATSSMASGTWLGTNWNGTKFFNGDIAELLIWGNGALMAQGAVADASRPGLGANFDAWNALRDRYRL